VPGSTLLKPYDAFASVSANCSTDYFCKLVLLWSLWAWVGVILLYRTHALVFLAYIICWALVLFVLGLSSTTWSTSFEWTKQSCASGDFYNSFAIFISVLISIWPTLDMNYIHPGPAFEFKMLTGDFRRRPNDGKELNGERMASLVYYLVVVDTSYILIDVYMFPSAKDYLYDCPQCLWLYLCIIRISSLSVKDATLLQAPKRQNYWDCDEDFYIHKTGYIKNLVELGKVLYSANMR